MSIIPKSWTGVDELRDQVWQLQQKVELLEILYARVPQLIRACTPQNTTLTAPATPKPVSVDPAGKIGHSVAPTPAIAKHDDKAPDVSPALEFYNAAGGYAWFKRHATKSASVVHLYHRTDSRGKQWQATFGSTHKGRSKSKTFDTRREAEQFAFDVLTIHEAECIKRKAPTDWWNRVKIFEVIKR